MTPLLHKQTGLQKDTILVVSMQNSSPSLLGMNDPFRNVCLSWTSPGITVRLRFVLTSALLCPILPGQCSLVFFRGIIRWY